MARPVLTRFDVFLFKPKSPPGDVTQVVAPGAIVEFYRQGATVTAGVTIGAGGGSIQIQDIGAITVGSILVAGTSGTVLLTVTGVTGATQVSVTKPSGTADVVITAGTRLFVVSDRPKVFQDPLGTVSIGSAVQGDASGRVVAYVSERRFDYVVAEGYFGITSTATVSNSTALSWFHGDSGGTGKFAIIGISWTGQTGTGNPPLVTYGGTAMSLIASMAACAVYGLANPPPNSQVVAAFDDMVAAVGGGVTVIGADLASSPKWGTNYGASNDGSLTIASPYLWGLLVDCLSLPQLPLGSPITPIPANGQQQRWSEGVDLPDFFQVRGAASTKLAAGVFSGTSWDSLGNNEWNLAGVELRRRVISSHIDVIGGTVPSPAWLNARDFARLRDAVNALPQCGGEVFLSSGSHIVQGETLVIDKPNVTLRGEGKETSTIIGVTPTGGRNPEFDIIRATGPNFRLVDLKVDGNAENASAYSAVVLSGPDAGDCMLKSVQLTQAGYAGLLLDGTPSLLAVQVEFLANLGCGVDAAAGTSAFKRIRLIGCWSSQNRLSGIRLSATTDDLGDVLILGCGFESNLEVGASDGNALGIYNLGGVRVIACSFEWNPGPEVSLVPEQFIYANNARGLHVEGCLLVGMGGTEETNRVKRAIHCQACSQVAFVNNGGFQLENELATFADCTDVVEYANWDGTPGSTPRISGDNGFGLSRASVSLPRYAGALLLPASPGRGALAWDDATGALRLFDGSGWRTVVYA